jgi:hypothetical protein
MTYNVKIDGSTPTGKKIIKDLRRHPKTVKFENPAETGVVPEGYMTGEEFWDLAKKDLDNICKKHGLL